MPLWLKTVNTAHCGFKFLLLCIIWKNSNHWCTFQACIHWTEHLKLLDRRLSLVRRFGLCGQDTCLLSVRLSMSGVEHTVTHTICYLQHSWLGQTRLWVGNGADKTCDLDTVSYVWSTERGRGRLMRAGSPFCFWFVKEKAAESHVAWKHDCLSVWWESLSLPLLSYSASKINIKSPHSVNAHSLLWPYARLQMPLCNYSCHMPFSPGFLHHNAVFRLPNTCEGTFPGCIVAFIRRFVSLCLLAISEV